jgi:hypothetical protein
LIKTIILFLITVANAGNFTVKYKLVSDEKAQVVITVNINNQLMNNGDSIAATHSYQS